jgi:hypothetical protein
MQSEEQVVNGRMSGLVGSKASYREWVKGVRRKSRWGSG